jgi:hypothetical protein
VKTGLQKAGPRDADLLWRTGPEVVALFQSAETDLAWGSRGKFLVVWPGCKKRSLLFLTGTRGRS